MPPQDIITEISVAKPSEFIALLMDAPRYVSFAPFSVAKPKRLRAVDRISSER